MTKSESRYFQTARRMDEALLRLLTERDFGYISIKELCAEAGVNRSTFYLHYENLSELLSECLDYMQERFYAAFGEHSELEGSIADCPKDELHLARREYLVPYLRYIKENRRLYAAAMANPTVFRTEETVTGLNARIFDPILDRFQVKREHRNYIMAFCLGGISAIVALWLRRGCDTPEEEVAGLIEGLIPKN